MDNQLNMSSVCATLAKRTTVILRCINRDLLSRSRQDILCLDLALELCVQLWCLQFKKDADKLEKGGEEP